MVKDLEKIIKHYGANNQIKKAKEELAELIEALDEDDVAHIAEEIADVLIMLKQIVLIHGIDNKFIDNAVTYKIQRTHLRMKGELENEQDNNDDSVETDNQEE